MTTKIQAFLTRLEQGEKVSFDQTMRLIDAHYEYTPVQFSNGGEQNPLVNKAGSNQGSCKIFSFATIHQLNKEQTLSLFGDFYWRDVLQQPDADNHANIRHFMQYGWEGIHFSAPALTPRQH